MQMDEGLDTGDILYRSVVEIAPDDTADSLYDKLSDCGGSLIVEALDRIEAGDVHPVEQDHTQATYAKILDKNLGRLNFNKPCIEIERLVRGLNSWPGTYTYHNGKMIKIWESKVTAMPSNGMPGTVYNVENGRLFINTSDYALELISVQLEGKKRMDVKSFLLGYKMQVGDRFE